jgi:hypothetical protein
VDACAGGHDIDDGIDCAYFVEMNFFYVYVVDLCFAGAQEFECPDGGCFDCGGKVRCVDEGADCGQRTAVVMLVFVGVIVAVACFVIVPGLWLVLVGGFGHWGRIRFGQLCAFEDVNPGRGDSAAVGFFDLQGRAKIEGGCGFVEDIGFEASIDEGSEEHVTTDACEAVQVSDTHRPIVS